MQHMPESRPVALPRRTLWQAFSWRTLKYGSHASLFTVIVLAVAVLVYVVAEKHNQRFDVTRGKRFTLAEQSIKLVKELKQPIQVLGFFRLEDNEREQFQDLLKQYTYHSDKMTYELIDLDRDPARAELHKVKAYGTVMVIGNGKDEKLLRLDEAALTNAIVKVTRDSKKVIYFVAGHGEPSLTASDRTGYSLTKQSLESQNYVVQELVLARQAEVPADAAVVIVAGPRQDLLESEMQSLETFLGRGGHLLLLLDPDTARGFMPFVQHYGLELSEDVIIETNPLGRLVGGDYLVPVVMSYEPHAITKDFGNIMSIFPVVRSVQVSKELPEGITAQALASTSPESWAETDMQGLKEGRSAFDEASDRRGPVSLAAVANIAPKTPASQPGSPAGNAPEKPENPTGGRLVVFGDSEFANNNFFASPGNGNLFLNTVSWLAEEEDLIAIRPRQGGKSGPVIVTAEQAPWLFWLPVVLLPLAVFTSGAVVFFRRRWQQ